MAQVDDREVGVEAGLEPAFAREPEAVRRRGARQRCNHLEREAAALGDGEQRAPERLAAGDAAPDRERIVTLLQLGRRRRVVGRDDRDRAREQLRPERLDLDARPQRRRALGERADALRVLVGEQEVVGARLAGHVDATGARLGDEQHRGGRARVDDVQRAAGLLRHRDRARRRPRALPPRDATRGSRTWHVGPRRGRGPRAPG